MKSLKDYIHEGVLSDVEDTINGIDGNIEQLYKIPSLANFKKDPYDRCLQHLFWDISYFLSLNELNKSKYPNIFKENTKNWHYMDFVIERIQSKHFILYIRITERDCIPTRAIKLYGYQSSLPGDLKQQKQVVLDLINSIANDPKKFNDIFERANNTKNDVKIKNLLDLLKDNK